MATLCCGGAAGVVLLLWCGGAAGVVVPAL